MVGTNKKKRKEKKTFWYPILQNIACFIFYVYSLTSDI